MGLFHRSRSNSASSTSSNDSHKHGKHHGKTDQDGGHSMHFAFSADFDHHHPSLSGVADSQSPAMTQYPVPASPLTPGIPQQQSASIPQTFWHASPLPYQAPPPSGNRVPLATESAFPPQHISLPPPFVDADGHSPVFFGSALFDRSVHPCKIVPQLRPPCRVPYGGREHSHFGRYDLLPYTNDMELVPASGGHIPHGRRPVEGGYEENGDRLYHAVAVVDGVRVPGKTGPHLGGCNIAFGGGEHTMSDNYQILFIVVGNERAIAAAEWFVLLAKMPS